MRTIEDTPSSERFLQAIKVWGPEELQDGMGVISEWIRKKGDSASNPKLISDFLNWKHSNQSELMVFTYAYADIPLGESYDMVFTSNGRKTEATKSVILHSLWNGCLPWHHLEHGHKSITVVDFPEGKPNLLKRIEEHSYLGFCNSQDWPEIKTHITSQSTQCR